MLLSCWLRMYIYALHQIIRIIPCPFPTFIHIFMHIGSPKGITLLEFETVGEEDQQPIALEGEEQVPED